MFTQYATKKKEKKRREQKPLEEIDPEYLFSADTPAPL
jgi:hypothetical protein